MNEKRIIICFALFVSLALVESQDIIFETTPEYREGDEDFQSKDGFFLGEIKEEMNTNEKTDFNQNENEEDTDNAAEENNFFSDESDDRAMVAPPPCSSSPSTINLGVNDFTTIMTPYFPYYRRGWSTCGWKFQAPAGFKLFLFCPFYEARYSNRIRINDNGVTKYASGSGRNRHYTFSTNTAQIEYVIQRWYWRRSRGMVCTVSVIPSPPTTPSTASTTPPAPTSPSMSPPTSAPTSPPTPTSP